MSTFSGGMPDSSEIRFLASTEMLRWRPSKSHTTKAIRVEPSSSTRQRACSSSWMWVAGNGTNPPTTSPPRSGVILLVAAPARRAAAVGAAMTGAAARSRVRRNVFMGGSGEVDQRGWAAFSSEALASATEGFRPPTGMLISSCDGRNGASDVVTNSGLW